MLALTAPVFAEIAECPPVETSVMKIDQFGNILFDITIDALLDLGYEYGDILRVDIGDINFYAPLCEDYTNVDVGALVVCNASVDNTETVKTASAALNMGDLATWTEIAKKSGIDEEPGFFWDYDEKYSDNIPVKLSLREKGGYLEQLALHQLKISNAREDYPGLTDEQFANFRNVATTGVGANVLYRSASPVNPAYNRNHETDAAVNAAGISTVMNMSDSEAVMKG